MTTLIARAAQRNLGVDALQIVAIHGNVGAMARKADAILWWSRGGANRRADLNTSKREPTTAAVQDHREERQSGGAVHEACPPHSSAGIVANMAASTVAQYLAALPADRRAALSAVRKVINENLPDATPCGVK